MKLEEKFDHSKTSPNFTKINLNRVGQFHTRKSFSTDSKHDKLLLAGYYKKTV